MESNEWRLTKTLSLRLIELIPLANKIIEYLVNDYSNVKKLPNMKRLRIDDVPSMVKEVRTMLKYSIPDKLQIFVFNRNGKLIEMSLFGDILHDNVIKKVNNLYLYFLMYKQKGKKNELLYLDIEILWNGIKENPNLQDLRIYSSKISVSAFAKYLSENNSIWLLSLSFDHLKPTDAKHIIEIIKKIKNLKELWIHHNQLEDDGWNCIATYLAENLITQLDYIDFSNNDTKENTYKNILLEKGYKGVLK